MAAAYWRSAGFTFNRYSAIAARTLRRALKEDTRADVSKVDNIETKAAKWEKGHQLESKELKIDASSHK